MQALDADRRPEVVDDKVADIVECLDIAHLDAPLDVLLEDLVDDRAHIGAFVGKIVVLHCLGKTALLQIVVEFDRQIGVHALAEKRLHVEIFVKTQRKKFKLHISAGELGRKFAAEQIGIGTGDEHRILARTAVGVDHLFKPVYVLNFVDEQILRPLSAPGIDDFLQPVRRLDFAALLAVKVEKNYVLGRDSAAKQLLFHHSHKARLARTPYTGDDLDDLDVMIESAHLLEILFTKIQLHIHASRWYSDYTTRRAKNQVKGTLFAKMTKCAPLTAYFRPKLRRNRACASPQNRCQMLRSSPLSKAPSVQ